VLVAILFAILGNIGRTFFLCWQGATRGIESIKGVHDAAGWSVMAFTAAGVGAASWLALGAQQTVVRTRKARGTSKQAVEADAPMRNDGRK